LDAGTLVLLVGFLDAGFAFAFVAAALAFVVDLETVLAVDVFLAAEAFLTVVEAAFFFAAATGVSAFFLVAVAVDALVVVALDLATFVAAAVVGFFAVVGFNAVEVALGLADADLAVVDLVVGLAAGLATVAVLVVAAFFTVFTGLFSFDACEGLFLGASLTLPDIPFGRVKTPLSEPVLMERLI